MKAWVVAVLAICMAGAFSNAFAAPTDVRTLHALTNQQAMQRLPVEFEATVTYYRDYDTDLFVQDGDTAIYVVWRAGDHLVPGDRIRVRGKTQDSFRPIVVAEDIKLLHHGQPPTPIHPSAAELFSAQRDSLLATVRGTVRSAQMVWSAGRRNIYMQVLIDGGYIDAAVNSDDAAAAARLLDSEIEMTGIVTSEFDQKMQQSGARIDVQSLADIRILTPADIRPQDLPVTPMQSVLGDYHIRDLSARVQIKGTITYYQPRRAVVLQTGNQSLWIATQTDIPLRIGNIAYASGFPSVRNGYLMLDHGEIRDTGQPGPVTPRTLNWDQIGFGEYAFLLVTAEGELVMQAREASQDEYVFTSHGLLFSAIYRHPRGMKPEELPPMKVVPVGSTVRVSGINMFYNSDPFDGPAESNLMLRDSDDIAVVAAPSLLNKRNLEIVVAFLVLIVLGISGRGWQLERRLRRQTTALAAAREQEAELERRRSRILERINGTGPLGEILEWVAELVSFPLAGAPCWCETRDGASFGNRPQTASSHSLICEQLHTGGGGDLGHICVAMSSRPTSEDAAFLIKAAGLAALAIETRRLYADLVHRSEFDILTNAHSRYYLERELDVLIQIAEANHGSFGLIYFDLDGFKSINDSYGHRAGDEFLQELAARIKSQLRSQDKLARLGGDEFAVLVPLLRGREDLSDIIVRLKRSLEEPIEVEGRALRCSASFGTATYPQDATGREELLHIADSAMYAAKLSKSSNPVES